MIRKKKDWKKQISVRCSTYTMKSSMSMDLALFSLKSASCKTLSIFLLMLKSAGTSCEDGAQDIRFKLADELKILKSDRSAVSTTSNVTEKIHYDSPHCVQSSESCSSFPAAVLLQWTWKLSIKMMVWFFFPPHALLTEQTCIRMAAFAAGRYLLESCIEGLVFPYKGYSDQAIPLLFWEKEKNHGNLLQFISCFDQLQSHNINIHRVKPHLEVNWRRRIFRFYPDNT